MHIHTFRAESLQAALQQVRRQLGPDAAILNTREKRTGRLGIFAKPVIEVDATLGGVNGHTLGDTLGDTDTLGTANGSSLEPDLTAGRAAAPLAAHGSAQSASKEPAQRDSGPPSRRSNGARRAEAEPASAHSAELAHRHDPRSSSPQPAAPSRAARQIAERLKISGAIELPAAPAMRDDKPYVVALVGPTGCGKTTSLSKIAAGFRFGQACNVGLIALDTFRLGAVDQLLQQADMLSASLEVVSSAEQVPAALQRLRKCDLVLLDTAGRAPRDTAHMAELHQFLELARPQATQLVVSASSSTAHVRQTVECYSVLKPTDLLITKLDEAVDFESWLTLLEQTQLPISYLTHGQRVPQDISPATAERLASLLLGQPLNFQQLHSPQPHVDSQQPHSQPPAVQPGEARREPGELQLSN